MIELIIFIAGIFSTTFYLRIRLEKNSEKVKDKLDEMYFKGEIDKNTFDFVMKHYYYGVPLCGLKMFPV